MVFRFRINLNEKKLLVEKDVFKMDLIKFLNCFKVKCFKVIYNEF